MKDQHNTVTICNIREPINPPAWKTNNYTPPHKLIIDEIYQWMGASRGFRGDLHVHINRFNNLGQLVSEFAFLAFDKYSETSGKTDRIHKLPRPIILMPDEILQVVRFAAEVGQQAYDPGVIGEAHWHVQLHFYHD